MILCSHRSHRFHEIIFLQWLFTHANLANLAKAASLCSQLVGFAECLHGTIRECNDANFVRFVRSV